jgi:hypothetical protein
MISSPSPISPPPQQPQPSEQEKKKIVRNTLAKRRPGQAPLALFVKAIFRPIFKGIYYLLKSISRHKLITVLVILLLFASSSIVNYFETGQAPFGIGYDQFNFQIRGGDGGGEKVKNWLYAVRDGDVATIQYLDSFMSSPPDATTLVSLYSQKQSHLTWRTINVVGKVQESDTTVDSLVEVDLSNFGPGGAVTGYLLFHFVTVGQQGGVIISIDVIPTRASQG